MPIKKKKKKKEEFDASLMGGYLPGARTPVSTAPVSGLSKVYPGRRGFFNTRIQPFGGLPIGAYLWYAIVTPIPLLDLYLTAKDPFDLYPGSLWEEPFLAAVQFTATIQQFQTDPLLLQRGGYLFSQGMGMPDPMAQYPELNDIFAQSSAAVQ